MTASAAPVVESTSSPIDALLSRVGGGDRHAFDQLYGLTAPRLFGLIRRVVRDAAQSEEVGQEVFLEIWETAARFDPAKGRGIGWIFTMAHRRAVDRVRASQSSRDRDLRIDVRACALPSSPCSR